MDVYQEWLGIPPGPRPPDHYELLRCVRFEDDTDKIRAHYRKLNAHVKKYATGKYANESQELLNEMAKAMLCLTDGERKRDYDEGLGREFESQRDEYGRQPLLDVLIRQERISREQKREVEDYCRRTGLTERDAVVQMKMVSPEQAAQALAMQLGFSYVDLEDMLPDDAILDAVPRALVRKHSFLPLFIDDDRLLIACVDQPEHALEEELQLRFEVPVRAVIATPSAVKKAISQQYAAGARDEAAATRSASPAKAKSGKSAGATPAKPSGGKRVPFDKLSPDEQQQRKQIGYIIICWTVIFFMLPEIVHAVGLAPSGPLFGLSIWYCVPMAALGGGAVYWWVTQSYWK